MSVKTSGAHRRLAISSRDTIPADVRAAGAGVHRLPRQRNAATVPTQLPCRCINFDVSEAVRHAGVAGVICLSRPTLPYPARHVLPENGFEVLSTRHQWRPVVCSRTLGSECTQTTFRKVTRMKPFTVPPDSPEPGGSDVTFLILGPRPHPGSLPRSRQTAADGSGRGAPALNLRTHRSISMRRRSARSCTRASVAIAYACDCQTPTDRVAGDRVGPCGHQRRGCADFPGTDRVLTFNGQPGITIPSGAVVVSDPVALDVAALSDLAVSLYLPEDVAATTRH